ncbi:hypothetical protein CORMATOL_00318 [Corynebacterium matruchotii ATCC 33806]|uniref:Uncharacterized protein n=1 Tax=Corynebacterium matruchotii ATCC 33806 TaxID=566549 RepID=C0E019_9CORY|nr:hypothetical protein CORMATOL_00318 [Corynebacterium matruchotii ATCC 33806]
MINFTFWLVVTLLVLHYCNLVWLTGAHQKTPSHYQFMPIPSRVSSQRT